MADLDKLLRCALRREDWLSKDFEKQLRKFGALRTVAGQLIFYLVHRQIRTMPEYCWQTSVRQLWVIEWKGDRPEEMKSFLRVWDYILENMNPAEIPLDITLTDLFVESSRSRS